MNALAFDGLVASPAVRGSANSSYHAEEYLSIRSKSSTCRLRLFSRRPGRVPRSTPRRGATARRRLRRSQGSEGEIRALRDVWPRQRLTTIESLAATESVVKSRMPNFRVVHFAVHATADTRDPLASHLRLVADSIDDGFFPCQRNLQRPDQRRPCGAQCLRDECGTSSTAVVVVAGVRAGAGARLLGAR